MIDLPQQEKGQDDEKQAASFSLVGKLPQGALFMKIKTQKESEKPHDGK